MAYNVKNYVRMARTIPGEGRQEAAMKPQDEVEALISIIAAEKPDIIGVCEMGAPAEFADFLARLKTAGVDLPHTEFVQALDLERHVALASRFPITSRNSQTDLSFLINEKKFYYKRGILDVTVAISDSFQLRLVGTHLKSRREVPEDQALLRRNEAHLLRQHAKAILDREPQTKLLVYGDLNDTINEAPIREILGRKRTAAYLRPLDLKDKNGDRWTYRWAVADIYSRIDFALASRELYPHFIEEKSGIPHPANWELASDHRPLVVVFKTVR